MFSCKMMMNCYHRHLSTKKSNQRSKKMAMNFFGFLLSTTLILNSCTNQAGSSGDSASKDDIVANFKGQKISAKQAFKDIEDDLFDLRYQIFQMKRHHLKSFLIEKLALIDPKINGRSADDFIKEEVVAGIAASKAKVKQFIKDRKIPKDRLDDEMMKRIKEYLAAPLKEKALDEWFAKKSKDHKVEMFLSPPDRPYFDFKGVDLDGPDVPMKGNPKAKVTVVEFADFQCSACRKGVELTKKIQEEFGDKVRIIFKHFPLPQHREARKASHASMCAREQDKKAFWKMHDLMFANQSALNDKEFSKLAKQINLDTKKFKACMKSNKHESLIEKNISEGKMLQVRSTPTFFVNGRMIKGAQQFHIFEDQINKALK